MRIIYDNAAARATLTASSEASSSLAAANLKTPSKGQVWRATSTSATLTLTWGALETIAGVALPFCNLTAAATIQVKGYTNTTDTTPLFDTGAVTACPGPTLGLWGWTNPLGANAFAYGGGTYARCWVPVPGACRKVTITLADPTNPAGYVEAGLLVVGAYWAPQIGADKPAPFTPVDLSTHYRNDAGDLMTDVGTRHRKLDLSLSSLSPADRNNLWYVLRGNGMNQPLFVSVFPDDADPQLEQDYMIYAKLTSVSAVQFAGFQRFATTLALEEV